MRKTLYNTFIAIGLALFFVLPLIDLFFSLNFRLMGVKLSAFGALIIGLTFLINYFTCNDKSFRTHFWWQVGGGIYLLLVFFFDTQNIFNNKAQIQIALYLGAMIVLYFQYKILLRNRKK